MSETKLANPYLDAVDPRALDTEANWRLPDGLSARMTWRSELVPKFAWAIPNQEAIEAIAKLGPIVELGAGGGYWSWMLREAGADVIAYDPTPGRYNAAPRRVWTEVEAGDHTAAAKHGDRALLLVWPTYDDPWSEMAVRLHAAAGGSVVAYVGEPMGGCTGSDEFHHLLASRYEVEEVVAVPQYLGLHDELTIWRKR